MTANRPNECTATFDEAGTEVTARFVDVEPPVVAFTAESRPDGAVLGPNSGSPSYAVDAVDNFGVARVEFRDTGSLFKTVLTPPWSSGSRSLVDRPDGSYAFRATAYDTAGNTTAVERRAVYDSVAPVVQVSDGETRYTSATFGRPTDDVRQTRTPVGRA